MLLLLVAAAALAFTGVSTLRDSFLQSPWEEEVSTLPPVTRPAQLAQAGQLRYHRSNLDEAGQAAYDAILARLPGFPESVKVENLGSEAFGQVFSALALDQPLIFHISTTHYRTRTSPATGLVTAFVPEYNLDREEYAARCEALAAACQAFTVPAGGSDYDIELALHDQLVRACAYSEEIELPEKSTAYGALVEGSASCEGYARAVQLLMDLHGIPCYIVTGEASNVSGVTGGHAWNKVRIEGAWYHLDATWNDPVTEDGSHVTSHAYFNLTDEAIGRTHELTDTRNPCTAAGANYFVRKGLEFGALDRAAEDTLAKALCANLAAGDNAVELRFTSDAAMEAGLDYLFGKSQQRVYRVLSDAAQNGAGIRTDKVFHADLTKQRVVRILPVKK